MPKLNFTAQTARVRPLKAMSSKFKESDIRPNIEVSDGIRPALPMIPLRYLPVKYQDITTEQWVVIPKGRIVSGITAANSVAEPYSLHLDITDYNESGLAESGDIQTGLTSQVDNSTAIVLNADNSYYGISRNIIALMSPANGGVAFEVAYVANDVTAVVPSVINTGEAVAVDEGYTLPANMPIGVAMYDVYQDIRGANLNYELWKNYGILAEQYIKVPFADIYELEKLGLVNANLFTNCSTGAPLIKSEAKAGYAAVELKYSFLTFDSSVTGHGLSGMKVKPDIYGNYAPQGNSLTQAVNTQTVGRLLAIDTRHPKDLLDTVDTYFDQKMTGTKTAGVPKNLYDFVETALVGMSAVWGSTDRAITIRDAIQTGAFGYAYIQIDIK